MLADSPIAAVTFDVGQTLTRLDIQALAARVRELGAHAAVAGLDSSLPEAWRVYNEVIRLKTSDCPWKVFMSSLLQGAGVRDDQRDALVERLWAEQPHRNLWRQPVPGMIDVVDSLRRAGVTVGVVSNSEGRVAELLDELGWLDRFQVVADSGRLGYEKPDPRIFRFACDAMSVRPEQTVHIGDSRSADVDGALGAGLRAIWFQGEADGLPRDRARTCATPDEIVEVLGEWGVAVEQHWSLPSQDRQPLPGNLDET